MQLVCQGNRHDRKRIAPARVAHLGYEYHAPRPKHLTDSRVPLLPRGVFLAQAVTR